MDFCVAPLGTAMGPTQEQDKMQVWSTHHPLVIITAHGAMQVIQFEREKLQVVTSQISTAAASTGLGPRPPERPDGPQSSWSLTEITGSWE